MPLLRQAATQARVTRPLRRFSRAPRGTKAKRDGLRSMTCSSCGAEITCDATTAVSECPYCGNPAVTPGAFVDMARPDGVVPFKLDKDAAVAALNDYYKGKRFLPKKFIAANKVEHIQGVYVPFWLYDGSVEGSGTFECRNERTYRSGDEEVTRTTVYEAYRAGDLDFERVPVDGSAKMPTGTWMRSSRTISTR